MPVEATLSLRGRLRVVLTLGLLAWPRGGMAAPASSPSEEAALPSLDEGPAPKAEPSSELVEAVALPPRGGQPEPSPQDAEPSDAPAPTVQGAAQQEWIVGVGLAEESPGTSEEMGRLTALRESLAKSPRPRARVVPLTPGSDGQRRACRESKAELVITVGHLPDRPEAVLVPYDCVLGEPLGIRPGEAANDPELLGVLWDEHESLRARGVQDDRRGLTRKARTGLIATGAVVLIGGAVAAIVIGTLRTSSTVLKVEPE